MESLNLNKIERTVKGKITITGSKSETNRLLILQQLYPNLTIINGSNSDDSDVMQKAFVENKSVVDIGHAGTAMRFLTSFFASKEGVEVVLTGSDRMKNRPIEILVNALKDLGANITYLEKEGFPPLKIKGKKLLKNTVFIKGDVSSQYISSLLLMGASLQKGLEINFTSKPTSVPYIKMTLALLQDIGINCNWEDAKIVVLPKPYCEPKNVVVESDWSSASYYFSLCALSKNSEITLNSFKKNSLQGDSVLVEIYKNLGVETSFLNNTITLKNSQKEIPSLLNLNLINAPDIAQTIAVTCFGLGIGCILTGLHTLKIKETDRLVALKTEIEKLGGEVVITNNSLQLKPTNIIKSNIAINTYHDHRMAMAFAPLATKVPILINDYKVVSKSYPTFWDDFNKITG